MRLPRNDHPLQDKRCAPVAFNTLFFGLRGTEVCPRRRFERQFSFRGHGLCPASGFMGLFRLRGHAEVSGKPHDSAIFAETGNSAANMGVPPQLKSIRFPAAGAHARGHTPGGTRPGAHARGHTPGGTRLLLAEPSRQIGLRLCDYGTASRHPHCVVALRHPHCDDTSQRRWGTAFLQPYFIRFRSTYWRMPPLR